MSKPIELKAGQFEIGDTVRFSQHAMDMIWIGRVASMNQNGLIVEGHEFTAKPKYGQKFSILEKYI